MEKAGREDKRHSLWYLAALLAPVTHIASGVSWPTALGMGAAALLGTCSRWGYGWLFIAQKLWSAVVAGIVLRWSAIYWEGMMFGRAAPLVLLALALWTVSVPEKGRRIGCVLIWPLAILLGTVLLSGVSEIKPAYLKPDWRLPELTLLAFLLIPSGCGKGTVCKMSLTAVAVSVITAGVLSPKVSASVKSGIYELARSIGLLGVAERFESLAAAAMTLGFYCCVTYLLEKRGGTEPIWGYGGIAALIYLIEIPLQDWFLVAGSALLWLLLPILQSNEKILEKRGKSA